MAFVQARGVQRTLRMHAFHELKTEADLDAALAAELAVVYKHSPLCGLSMMARLEMTWFAQGNPAVPIWLIDVIRQRSLSESIAARFEIEHESPQVILLRRGRPIFDASHRGVSSSALERELERVRAA